MNPAWAPRLGAVLEPDGVRFRVFAPDPRQVELLLEAPGGETARARARRLLRRLRAPACARVATVARALSDAPEVA